MSQQQTLLRVRTNIPSTDIITGSTSMTISGSTTGVTYSGAGTNDDPYIGSFGTGATTVELAITGDGTFFYDITLYNVGIGNNNLQAFVLHPEETFPQRIFLEYYNNVDASFEVYDGDIISFKQGVSVATGGTFNFYITPNVVSNSFEIEQYDFLDLYNDIPITINKSFAEIQDIAKRNSDYSIGLKIPGSKKNNRFFENFFNVDQTSLYFDVTKKVKCQVLIDDQAYFRGYLKLNSVSVQNSKIEYDVTLYSDVADLYGKIGNNLLKDLDFSDVDYHFNHYFSRDNVLKDWRYETLKSSNKVPSNYFYPVIHNGYVYKESSSGQPIVQTGTTTGTSIYTTTKLGSFVNNAAAYSAGVERGHINSPEDGARDNQLKPALNIWSIIQLMFKRYGYTIKSDFMTTPWMKLLYMYGYFSNDSSKFSYKTPSIQRYSKEQCEVVIQETSVSEIIYCDGDPQIQVTITYTVYVVKKGTGIPVLCTEPINLVFDYRLFKCGGAIGTDYQKTLTIPSETTGGTLSWISSGNYQIEPSLTYSCPACTFEYQQNFGLSVADSDVQASSSPLAYLPQPENTIVTVSDGTYVDFSLIIDENIKQIDILSSIAKKFNLLFIPDPDVPNQIIIEPFQYYVGTGNVYDWTDKISWDKGFTVQPAQNFIESELILTDQEDGDSGNKAFQDSNQKRIYGQNIVPNPTEFKSQTKTIQTTFSPEVIRKWNPNTLTGVTNDVGIPLGIAYVESQQEMKNGVVDWVYKGIKSKPKIFFNVGNFSPFLDNYTEQYTISGVTTSYFRVTNSNGGNNAGSLTSPVISHTMPMGNPDNNKINNDSICILFNSEQPTTIAGDSVTTFPVYTDNDMYALFYQSRVDNAFDKNTRFLNGFFDLKLSDVKSLTAKDIIKINEQYFTWNKIDNFNLTNRELTKVELVQTNVQVSEYPTRYFKYYYCNDTATIYKFKTEFTGTDSIYESLFYYSILYDYFIGAIKSKTNQLYSGFTSSVSFTGSTHLPYTIYEVSENDYNATGSTLYTNDPQRYFFLLNSEENPVGTIYNQNNAVWLINSGQTQSVLNVFTGCTDFTTVAAEIGVLVAGATTGATLTSGATINVTDTGWIKYDTASTTEYQYISTTGNVVLSACLNCESIRVGIPLADLANFTIVSCGNSC